MHLWLWELLRVLRVGVVWVLSIRWLDVDVLVVRQSPRHRIVIAVSDNILLACHIVRLHEQTARRTCVEELASAASDITGLLERLWQGHPVWAGGVAEIGTNRPHAGAVWAPASEHYGAARSA